jgi:hypothetical protein
VSPVADGLDQIPDRYHDQIVDEDCIVTSDVPSIGSGLPF